MVKDETCNTYLPEENAIKQVIGGKTFYFCSKICQKKFLKKKTSAGKEHWDKIEMKMVETEKRFNVEGLKLKVKDIVKLLNC